MICGTKSGSRASGHLPPQFLALLMCLLLMRSASYADAVQLWATNLALTMSPLSLLLASDPAHSLLVCRGADSGAKDNRGAKASDKEVADVFDCEPVELVKHVHVGPLKPVSGCIPSKRARDSVQIGCSKQK